MIVARWQGRLFTRATQMTLGTTVMANIPTLLLRVPADSVHFGVGVVLLVVIVAVSADVLLPQTKREQK